MTSHSDEYDRLGFKASEIYPLLERHGVTLARSNMAARPTPASDVPEWVRPFIGRNEILLLHAAEIMAGLNPYSTEPQGDELVAGWLHSLIDACDAGEIMASSWSAEAHRDREQKLSHADIRKWCAARGHPWPIPDLNPQPAAQAEALAEIERLNAEIARLRAELANAKAGASFADHENWPDELDIAMIVWRAAVSAGDRDGKKPGVWIREWLDNHYADPNLNKTQRDRIATVANWDKTPGPK
ncbi:hypothetical protein [Burkholderia vietnamiensis]|uniref:hypothetical protein n=1 Tax=Burkholderia vietnamiensis TaxID=60552 RepID=UPI0026570EA2|nr:hypothetical protein [Burkholderia vietnamiensis]MDN7925712.1 hypothetical protein [Burkholderia vietnamiensis]